MNLLFSVLRTSLSGRGVCARYVPINRILRYNTPSVRKDPGSQEPVECSYDLLGLSNVQEWRFWTHERAARLILTILLYDVRCTVTSTPNCVQDIIINVELLLFKNEVSSSGKYLHAMRTVPRLFHDCSPLRGTGYKNFELWDMDGIRLNVNRYGGSAEPGASSRRTCPCHCYQRKL